MNCFELMRRYGEPLLDRATFILVACTILLPLGVWKLVELVRVVYVWWFETGDLL